MSATEPRLIRSRQEAPDPHPKVRRGVIGVLVRGPHLLMIQRADGVAKGGCWCFPGGHVEPGETPRRAVERELYEELAIRVEAQRRLGSIRVADSRHLLVAWTVRYMDGLLRPLEREIAGVRWVRRDEVTDLDPGLPSNAAVLDMLSRRPRPAPKSDGGRTRPR